MHNGVLLIAGSSLLFTQSKNVTYCATLVVQYKNVKQRHITTILFLPTFAFVAIMAVVCLSAFQRQKWPSTKLHPSKGYSCLTQFMTLFLIRLTAFTLDSQLDSEQHWPHQINGLENVAVYCEQHCLKSFNDFERRGIDGFYYHLSVWHLASKNSISHISILFAILSSKESTAIKHFI